MDGAVQKGSGRELNRFSENNKGVSRRSANPFSLEFTADFPTPPGSLLFFFLAGLAFNAQGGYRPGFKPLHADLFSAGLADAIYAAVDPRNGIIDLFEQFLFSSAESEDEVIVEFSHGLIRGIGKAFFFRADLARQRMFRLGKKILSLFDELLFYYQKFRIRHHSHNLSIQYKRAVTADVAMQPFEI